MTEPRQGKAKPRGVRHSPVELAKVVAMEIAGNPVRETSRIPRVRLAPIARILLAGVVIVGLLMPAIEGAGWVESAFGGQGTTSPPGTSTTLDDEVLSVLVRAPEAEERIGSSPLIDALSGSNLLGSGAAGPSTGQTTSDSPTPGSPVFSSVTSSTSVISTSTSVVPSTTVSTAPPSTTTSTTSATTTTTVPTTTTTCRGNSGGNGKGNNC